MAFCKTITSITYCLAPQIPIVLPPFVSFLNGCVHKSRIEIARSAFKKMNTILTSRKISINTRKRLCVCYGWSTLLYGSETWALTKITTKKLPAFEMWMLRRMLKILSTEHKTNNEVLQLATATPTLLSSIKKENMTIFGTLQERIGYRE